MKRIFMRSLDVVMFVLLMFLMAFHLTGQQVHEWLGMMTFLCFIVHHILNWKWHKNILKGQYKMPRKVITFINLILLIDILCVGISGMMMSQFVFRMVPSFGLISLARKVHMIASYWGFVLMSVHLGFHWHMMIMPMKKKFNERSPYVKFILFQLLPVVLCLAGVYSLIKNRIYIYLFSLESFVFFDYEMTFLDFILEYLLISALCIGLSYIVFKKIRSKKS